MAENPLQTTINNKFENSPVTVQSNRTPVPDTNITQNFNSGSLYYDPKTSSTFIDPRTFGRNSQIGRDINNDRYYDNYNKAVLNPFASDYFDTKFWGINLGSVTDLHSNPDRRNSVNLYSNAVDFEHLRRNEQSGFSAGLNLVNQFVGKTAVNAAGGIIAGFYGIGSAIANWDIDKLSDNSVARGFDSASKWIDENNSVFTSQRGRDNGYLGMFSYDTLKDFNDGLSFVSGVVLSEGLMGLASGGASLTTLPGRIGNIARKGATLMDRVAEATKASIGVNSTIKNTGGLYKRVDEINKAIRTADRAGLEQLALNLNTTVDDLAKYRRALDNFDSTIKGGRQLITSTFYEGGLEARHMKDEFLNNAMEKLEEELALKSFNSEEEKEAYRQSKIEEFNEMADIASFGTFALNAVLLRASNIIQFPSVFGSKTLSNMNKNSSKFTRESLGKVIQNNNKAGKYFNTVGSILKSPLTEFMEETGQGAISKFFDNYYESYLGLETAYPELSESNSKFGDALVKSLSDTYGTRDGLYEGVLGALLGSTGAPSITRNSKGKIRPTMAGGIYESVKNNKKNQKLLDDIKNNTIEYGTILGYNRDNAVLAAITGKKKDLANVLQDSNLSEEIDNNTIYTYVKDRLDKGVKDIMGQDVEEILGLDLDTYKSKFNRPDSFTEQEMKEEKDNFKLKVDSYTKAYEKVMNGLQMDRINNNPMTKKYFDILTYAVANEQIYTDAYNKAVQEILNDPNNKFTAEQINTISKHTSLFKGREQELLDYIEARKEEKLKAIGKPLERIKNKLEIAKNKLEEVSGSKELLKLFTEEIFDSNGNISERAKEDIEIIKKINKNNPNLFRELDLLEEVQTLQDIHNDVNKEFQSRAKSLKINPKRTKEGREKIKNIEEILEELNEKINKEKGEALNTLRGKKDKVILKDLEEYFDLSSQKEEMLENPNSISMIELLDSKQGKSLRELYDRIDYITQERTMAVEIAHSLYSNGQVSKGLTKLINASLNKNSMKLELYNNFVESTLNSSIADDALGILTIEFSNILEKNKKLLEEYKNNLNEEFAKKYEELIKKAESNLEKLNKIIEVNDKEESNVESQLKEQQKNQNKQEEEKPGTIIGKEKKDQELEEETEDNNLEIQKEIILGNKPEFDNSSPKIGKKNMTYTINQVPDSTQPEFKAFSDAIEDGTIQYNQGVTLELELSQEENDSFWEYIGSIGKKEDYLSGKDKILANPELLKEDHNLLDPDVKFFITVVPIRLNVQPNQVEIGLENKQDFEISESNDLPSILLPNGTFDYESKLDAKYESRLKAIEDQFEEDKKEIEKVTSDKKELERLLKIAQFNYIKQLEELNAEIASIDSKSNDKVNFFLRATVLYNQLGVDDAGPTKARVGNFVNGSIKKPELTIEQSDNKLVVTEDNVNGFVQDVEELSTKIVYGTQSGILHDINHDPVKLKEGSLVEAQHYQTGAIYYVHTTSNGQKIPILLNSAKLGNHPELVEELMDIMREYLKDPKPDDIVQLKPNSILKFLDNRFKYKEFFNLFLMPSRSGNSAVALNTFNIRSNSQNSAIYGAIEFGDPQLSSIKFLTQEEFDNNIKLIRNALSNYRFHLDVNMLKDKDGIIDKQALEFVFAGGLLTHHFNFASNPKEYKDYIFEPERGGKENKRAVQIHLINTDSNTIDKNKRSKKISSKEKIINLFRKNLDDKSNLSAANIVYNLNSKIGKNANSKISKYPKNKEYTPEIEKELILQAVEEEVNKLIDSINKIQTEPSANNRFTPDFESKLEEDVIIDLNKIDSTKWIDVAKAIVHNYKILVNDEKNYNIIKKLVTNRNYPFVLRKLLLGIDNGKMSSFILPDIKELNNKKTFDLESSNNSDPDRKFKKDQINDMVAAMQLINEISNTLGPKLFNNYTAKDYKANNIHINFTSSFLNSKSTTGYTRDINHFSVGIDGVTQTGLKKGKVGRNALQYLYFGKDNKIQGRESFEFYKYKDDKGNISYDEKGRIILIKVENPKSEFTYNSDGTIEDGVIIMNTKNEEGNYNEVLLVYGTENTDIMEKRPSLRNIVERIQLPFFGNGEIIQEDYDAAVNLLNNFKNNSEEEEKLINKTKAKIVDLSEMEKEDEEEKSKNIDKDLAEAQAAFDAADDIEKKIKANKNNSDEINIGDRINSSEPGNGFKEFNPDDAIESRINFTPRFSDTGPNESGTSDPKPSGDGNLLGLMGGIESFGPDVDNLPTLESASEEVQLNIPDGLIEAKKILFNNTRDKTGSNNATAKSRVNLLLKNKNKETYNKIYVELDTLGALKSQAYNKEFMIEYLKNIGIDTKDIIEIINFALDTKITEDDINRICK